MLLEAPRTQVERRQAGWPALDRCSLLVILDPSPNRVLEVKLVRPSREREGTSSREFNRANLSDVEKWARPAGGAPLIFTRSLEDELAAEPPLTFAAAASQ